MQDALQSRAAPVGVGDVTVQAYEAAILAALRTMQVPHHPQITPHIAQE
jgi:hypothetical protein